MLPKVDDEFPLGNTAAPSARPLRKSLRILGLLLLTLNFIPGFWVLGEDWLGLKLPALVNRASWCRVDWFCRFSYAPGLPLILLGLVVSALVIWRNAPRKSRPLVLLGRLKALPTVSPIRIPFGPLAIGLGTLVSVIALMGLVKKGRVPEWEYAVGLLLVTGGCFALDHRRRERPRRSAIDWKSKLGPLAVHLGVAGWVVCHHTGLGSPWLFMLLGALGALAIRMRGRRPSVPLIFSSVGEREHAI